MKLSKIQEHLVRETFTFLIDEIDSEGSLPNDLELDGYHGECSSRTLHSLQNKGFIKYFSKHTLGFSVTWNSENVYKWCTENETI